MPRIDVAATREAARGLGAGSRAMTEVSSSVATAGLTQQLTGSSTAAVLAELQTHARLRLTDAGRELSTLQDSLTTLADNVDEATGGAR